MNSQGRRLDHWTISLDTIEALRQRIAQVEDFDDDVIARRLMASVAHAKSSGFMALLDGSGHVVDVNPWPRSSPEASTGPKLSACPCG